MDRDTAAARLQARARGAHVRSIKPHKKYPSFDDERGFNLKLYEKFSPGFSYCQENVSFKDFEAGVLKNGANKVGGYKRTALMWAIRNKLEDHYLFLLDKCKCDLTMQDELGLTALHIAMMNDWNSVKTNKAAKCLIQAAGASLDLKCNEGVTPLHKAINTQSYAVSKLLIDKGFDVNAIERNGQIGGWNTPLHYAAKFNCLSICCLLIDAGAKRNIKNYEEFTPLELAEHYVKHSATNFLQVSPMIIEVLKTYQPNMNPNPYADNILADSMNSRCEEYVYDEVDFSEIGGTPEFAAREERENAERLRNFETLQIAIASASAGASEEPDVTATATDNKSNNMESPVQVDSSSFNIQDENSESSAANSGINSDAAAVKIQARIRGAQVRGVQVQQEQSESGLVASPPKNPKPSFNRPGNSTIKEA